MRVVIFLEVHSHSGDHPPSWEIPIPETALRAASCRTPGSLEQRTATVNTFSKKPPSVAVVSGHFLLGISVITSMRRAGGLGGLAGGRAG